MAATGPLRVTNPGDLATSGWGVADLAAAVDAWLASGPPRNFVLINIGVNNLGTVSQATYESNLAYVLDAIHAKWPRCKPLVMRVWKRGFNSQSDTMDDTWIPNVLASRAWSGLGGDERVFLKGADDGASETVDGIHPTTAGYTATAAAWKAAMGY